MAEVEDKQDLKTFEVKRNSEVPFSNEWRTQSFGHVLPKCHMSNRCLFTSLSSKCPCFTAKQA